ncbi:MAG: pseudaminic acid synthase [Candidatus Cloacimonetes bacterium]|nr:pseudaminic acid synthase [Candidatus Cloacimonadota bacterium]
MSGVNYMNDFLIEFTGNNNIFIVAELSANHKQDYDLAVKTIKAMKKAGADAVKLQTYTPDTITIDCNNEYFQIKEGLWKGENLYSLYQKAYTPWQWQPKLKKLAEDLDLVFLSTPFDKTAVDFLEEMNVPIYKVASFEITDIPLIEYIASKGKPIIMSTGIATLSDIEVAVNACREMGNDQITLLKCTSAYPAPIKEANLRTIPNMKETFNVTVGLSDHTIGAIVPIASVALGAKVIEKHFILDKSIDSPDAAFSMEPNEFKNMVKSIREVENALGTVNYSLSEKVKKNLKFGRSLFVVKDIKKGEKFTKENLRSIRPGYGLEPKYFKDVLGKHASCDVYRGIPFVWELLKQ